MRTKKNRQTYNQRTEKFIDDQTNKTDIEKDKRISLVFNL